MTSPSRLGPRPLRVEPCHGARADVLPRRRLCLLSGGDQINSSSSGLLGSQCCLWKQQGMLASAPPHQKLSARGMGGASDSFQATIIGTWPVPRQGPGQTGWAKVDHRAGGLGSGGGLLQRRQACLVKVLSFRRKMAACSKHGAAPEARTPTPAHLELTGAFSFWCIYIPLGSRELLPCGLKI